MWNEGARMHGGDASAPFIAIRHLFAKRGNEQFPFTPIRATREWTLSRFTSVLGDADRGIVSKITSSSSYDTINQRRKTHSSDKYFQNECIYAHKTNLVF